MHFRRLLLESLLWRGLFFVTFFIISVLLPRTLEATGVGWIYYLTFWFSFILMVASLNLESGVAYYASNGNININKLVWLSIVWTLLVGLISLLGLRIYFGDIRGESLPSQQNYLVFGLCYITGVLLVNFFSLLFYARKNYFLPNALLSAVNILFIVLIIAGERWQISRGDILRIYFWYSFAQGFILCLAYVLVYRSWKQVILPSLQESRVLIRYALLSLTANVVFLFVYRIDYWFVRHSAAADDVDLGNYIQASKLGQMLLIVPQIMATVVFPQTATNIDRAVVNRNIIAISRIFTQLYIIGFIVLALFGRSLFVWVFGDTFYRIYAPMLLLMPGMLALSILVLLSAYFAGKGNVGVNIRGAALALVVVFVGNLLFVDRYGIKAAAIVSTVGYSVNLVYALFRFYKDYNISWRAFFSWRKSDYAWIKQLIISKTNS